MECWFIATNPECARSCYSTANSAIWNVVLQILCVIQALAKVPCSVCWLAWVQICSPEVFSFSAVPECTVKKAASADNTSATSSTVSTATAAVDGHNNGMQSTRCSSERNDHPDRVSGQVRSSVRTQQRQIDRNIRQSKSTLLEKVSAGLIGVIIWTYLPVCYVI